MVILISKGMSLNLKEEKKELNILSSEAADGSNKGTPGQAKANFQPSLAEATLRSNHSVTSHSDYTTFT